MVSEGELVSIMCPNFYLYLFFLFMFVRHVLLNLRGLTLSAPFWRYHMVVRATSRTVLRYLEVGVE